MNNIERILADVVLPDFLEVKQVFDDRSIIKEKVRAHIKAILYDSGIINEIKSGTKVAITAGSRGICNIDLVLKQIAACVKERSALPYIVPCMGSHGGNAKGQIKILEHLNITEEKIGAPIVESDDLVIIGEDVCGRNVYVDKFISESDSIIVVNRIKPHTAFKAPVESGLQKMMVIGIGKQKGAETCHEEGFDSMYEHITSIADVIFEKMNVAIGVGIIENAYGEIYDCVALKGNKIREKEPEILNIARGLTPKILFEDIDILIVEEMGKDISGSGMDTNIIGRYPTAHISGGPQISKIVVLDLTDNSEGNAHGLGFADFTSKKLFNKINMENTYPNCLTNKVSSPANIPPVMPNDLLAIKAAIKTLKKNRDNPKIVWIKNTHNLEKIFISKAMYNDAVINPHVEIAGDFFNVKFDENGSVSESIW